METSPTVHLVVALSCEARPLARLLRLKGDPAHRAFRLFVGDGADLVVTGVGKVAAAAGTAYMAAAIDARPDDVWINVGVGGHRSEALGSVWTAHTIRDAGSGRHWHPPRTATEGFAAAEVVTIEEVEREYPRECVYEMEAAGFWPTATRFTAAELCQVVKVVSDGPGSSVDEVVAERVEGLITAALPTLSDLLDSLRDLASAAPPAPPALASELLERWHFSLTQRRQLERLQQRFWALTSSSEGGEEAGRQGVVDVLLGPPGPDAELRSATEVLDYFAQRVDEVALEREPRTPRRGS